MRRRRAAPATIDSDALWPRDEQHRWRIYARRGGHLDVVAATDCPEGIGPALVQIDADQREHGETLGDLGAIGVLDAVEGRWLILPWHRPDYSRGATTGGDLR